MSTTLPDSPAVTPGVTWVRVDSGFFVASAAGAFLGSVDRAAAGRYVARDGLAADLGSFASLSAAKRAVLARSRQSSTR